MNPDKSLVQVRVQFCCPKDCVCGGTTKRQWFHKTCGNASYMTSKGDFFCNSSGCSTYFIKDASFQCSEAKKNNSWYKHKSMSELLMALSLALQASELSLNGQDQDVFAQQILIEIQKRWNV